MAPTRAVAISFGTLLMALPFAPWLSACGAASAGSETPEMSARTDEEAPFDDAAARDAFENLEARLAAAGTVHLAFEIESAGAVASATSGALLIAATNRARLEASGEFQGRPVAPTLRSDGTRMVGGDERGRFDEGTPPGLNDAIRVGLTRMGLLHTIAALAGGAPPDRADGTVHEWVTTVGLEAGQTRQIDGTVAHGIRFEVLVAGAAAGEATLYVDAVTGLPVERRQVVRFASGEMQVVESYHDVRIDDSVDDAEFAIEE